MTIIPKAHILIVDDELHIRTSLKELLSRDGYEVVAVESGEAALERIVEEKFDLALVDLKLGKMGGMDVLAEIRQRSPDTITIVLTGHASLETAVETLRKGAHDYLFKPAKPAELRESIHLGLIKRQEMQQRDLFEQLDILADNLEGIRNSFNTWRDKSPITQRNVEGERRFLRHGELLVDLARHVVMLDGHMLDLSPTEFEILVYLMNQAPRVISPQEILREVQGYESESWEASEIVRQHIYRIRRKCQEVACSQDIIRTVRGVGYTID